MDRQGVTRSFSGNIISATCAGANTDLGCGWKIINAHIETNAQGFLFYASDTLNGTYRRIRNPVNPNTASVQGTATFMVNGGANSGVISILPGFRFIRAETTASQANGVIVNFICSN